MSLSISSNTISKSKNGQLLYKEGYDIKTINYNNEQPEIITIENQEIQLEILELTKTTLKLREFNISDGLKFTYTRN